MELLAVLMILPLISALLLGVFPQERIRGAIVKISAALLVICSLYLLIFYVNNETTFHAAENRRIGYGMLTVEVLLGIYILSIGFRERQSLIIGATLVQLPLMVYFELLYGHRIHSEFNLFVDSFSVIMAMIIGIIGSLITIYALRYMKDYHQHHPEVKDRSRLFFFVMFVFLSSMFGIVFSNNLMWIYFFWEITTFCSFILIGYSQTKEAKKNSFRALGLNLLGGCGFALAIVILYLTTGVIELDKMLVLGKTGVLIPAILIAFAGLTKSAQMPFSSWLLGAMVAPTPTSALLHSSTMVKAGVYILLRLSPVLNGTAAGFFVSLIGGVTFVLTSFIAISQSNGKKVLAYSTIANLGLIVACAGVGSEVAVWAGILLIIFHAVAKSLLFLCVGSVEHQIHSRDIEDMDDLLRRNPRLAGMFMVGIAGMFLAPFGMLISKWAALKAFVDGNIFLVVILAFGSAATVVFWTKWMGKLVMKRHSDEKMTFKISPEESFTLSMLTALTIIACALFPLISRGLIEPYLQDIYGITVSMSQGNQIIISIMLAMVVILPLSFAFRKSEYNYVPPYMCAANIDDASKFRGGLGKKVDLKIRNYYMDGYFSESVLTKTASVVCTCLIIFMFGVKLI
ncbi:MAG: NADH-quinone oxidoreductase subunit L [Bacillota bacterium]|jgi:ech hydrogenase subunit A